MIQDRPHSHAEFARARKLIPGGVNSPARAFGAVGGEPIFIDHAEGVYLHDLDGNRYLDFIGSWGPMILGHAHPAVLEATIAAAKRGSSYGAPTRIESELAELVIEAVPSIEMVRFVSSGTEAAMSAVRLARGFTGRNGIVKFAGCYHGHVDALLVSAGSSALTHGEPNSPGIPAGATQDTYVLPYNDVERLRDLFTKHGDSIAGVMLEPVVGNMGVVIPTEQFRKELRALTHQYGALLIYDEVMTGFRLSLGGAQQLFGDEPDMTALGKIVGGGYPAAAYGGRADVMQAVMPSGRIFQAGTLSGNPVAMAAGIATLRELKANPPYEHLAQLTQHLVQGLRSAANDVGIEHQINSVGSMWTLFFTGTPVSNFDTASTSDTKRYGRFFWEMMNRGVYLPCSQYESAFNSAPMTMQQMDETIAAAREAFNAILQ